jgi:hypothetical protein
MKEDCVLQMPRRSFESAWNGALPQDNPLRIVEVGLCGDETLALPDSMTGARSQGGPAARTSSRCPPRTSRKTTGSGRPPLPAQAPKRCRRSAAREEGLELKRECSRCAVVLDDRRLNAGVNRLPNGQVDAHHSPSLGRIGVAGNGHIEAIPPALSRDESASTQKTLQVAKEAWCVEEDVHAANRTLRELPQTEEPSLTVVRKPSASRG